MKMFRKKFGQFMERIITEEWECSAVSKMSSTLKVLLINNDSSSTIMTHMHDSLWLILDQERAGEFFYGLLHKRYTLTNAGIAKLTEKYEAGESSHLTHDVM